MFCLIKLPRFTVGSVLCVALFLITMSLPFRSFAATLPSGFTETSVTGFSSPTSVSLHPDGRIFVTQQGGALRVIKNGVLLATPFVTVSTTSTGERGLLSVAFDPNYAVNRYVYVYYTVLTPAIHNRISRFTADPNNEDIALAGSEFVVMDLDNLSGATNHNGGPIHFGPDGKLYVGVGENAAPSNAQSLSNRLGKILRINADGTIPGDNPATFPGITGSTTGLNQAIWSVGLRNPYTFSFQPGTGRMFINDVGNVTWEEIDNGVGGVNYGWPTCEGPFLNGTSTPCNDPNFTDPVYTYSSASGSECAITGGDFYDPATATFPASYVSKYFFADYCAGWIKYIDPTSPPTLGNATTFATGIALPIDIDVAPDGSLYYLARGAGAVFRVQFSAGVSPTPTSTPTNTPTNTPTQTLTSTPTSTPTATPADSIAGTVTYVNATSPPKFVSNVVISGAGSVNVSTTTAAPGPIAGTYTLSGFGSGSYVVTPSKVGGANGISSFDSARIAQHVAGLPPLLNANQLIAADASGNGTVSSLDAAQIAQYVVTTVGGHTGEWRFLPANRSYASVSGNISGEDYSAILIGEVSGNWNNTGSRAAFGSTARSINISAPSLVTKIGDEVVVPVGGHGIANKGIISYEFNLRYDPEVIRPDNNAVDLSGTASRGLRAAVNAEVPGLLRVAVYGPMQIDSSGVLFNLKFIAIGEKGAVSPLIWERMMLNEGSPFIKTTDGQIELF